MKLDSNSLHINGMKPFCGNLDSALERLDEAHALTFLLADIQLADDEIFTTLNCEIRSSVLRAPCALIAYAVLHLKAYAEEGAPAPKVDPKLGVGL